MIDGILTAIHEAENDDQIGAVVVHGREGKFSAGFDLGVMMADDQSAIVNLVANGGELVHPLRLLGTGRGRQHRPCARRRGLDAPRLRCAHRRRRSGKVGLNEVAIKMVLPDWALTIAGARLSKRHMQRSIVNARITSPADAVDVGFLDEVVPADELLDRAIAAAAELAATLDPRAYAGTIRAFRQETLDEMDTHIAAARASIT